MNIHKHIKYQIKTKAQITDCRHRNPPTHNTSIYPVLVLFVYSLIFEWEQSALSTSDSVACLYLS